LIFFKARPLEVLNCTVISRCFIFCFGLSRLNLFDNSLNNFDFLLRPTTLLLRAWKF
jgi:hypothetical protein